VLQTTTDDDRHQQAKQYRRIRRASNNGKGSEMSPNHHCHVLKVLNQH